MGKNPDRGRASSTISQYSFNKAKQFWFSQHFHKFSTYSTNTRHVCTCFNAFSMMIPNTVIKFHNFDADASIPTKLVEKCLVVTEHEKNPLKQCINKTSLFLKLVQNRSAITCPSMCVTIYFTFYLLSKCLFD